MANGENTVELVVEFDTIDQMMSIFGNMDEFIRLIERETDTRIAAGQSGAVIAGAPEKAGLARDILLNLIEIARRQDYIDENKVSYIIETTKEGMGSSALESLFDVVAITNRGKPIKCRSIGQKTYMRAIDRSTVVMAIGPAGTGKTYLAMAKAVVALKNKQVSRIILTRPAVEAGEKLGFLPGDLQNKVDPYLRPLYDALYDFMGADAYQKLSEKGVIEIAPLAYMRGRTLSDAFIILDEAQNCTMEQLKMFLTRFGDGSKVIVTGDITQIDLTEERKSGLKRTADLLKDVEGIEVITLTHRDVVRHKLVKDIIQAFERFEKRHDGRQRQ